ncbi:MAG: hypothetical protein K9N23_19415, partial [Akkermansiaceae bacterium]|nr:hypothetical protein [Akkermansiaceae bacterium]
MIQPSLRHLLAIAILLAAPGLLGAAPGRDTSETPAQHPPESSFEFGDRPSKPVFDLTGTLPTATLTEISGELDSIHLNDGIDLIVVVLKDLGGAPPEHVAGRFGKAWCSPLFHCVVLHVPGDPNGPWIVPGGKLLRRFSAASVRAQVAAACHRASLEPKEAEKVRAATT